MDQPTFTTVAERLISGSDFVGHLLWVVCGMMGIGFVIYSLILVPAHRNNPKFVPLSKPVMYLLLGLVLASIPFWGKLFAPTGSLFDQKQQETLDTGTQIQDIDAPL